MELCAEVRDVTRRIMNHKMHYNRLLSWSEIDDEETKNDIEFNKIIMLVVKPRPVTRTFDNMKKQAKLEWLTTTVPIKYFNYIEKKYYHLKNEIMPPKQFMIIYEEAFIFGELKKK